MSGALLVRAVVAVLLVAAAVALALLGSDVLRWNGQTERGAVALAAGAADPQIWEPNTALPAAASSWLLGIDDDLGYQRALQRYVVIQRRGYIPAGKTLIVAEADRALERVESSGVGRRTRSLARTLRGILLATSAAALGGGDEALIARVEDEFRRAIRLDPSNAPAKFDLERLLRVEDLAQRTTGAAPPERGGKRGSRGVAGGRGTSFGGGGY